MSDEAIPDFSAEPGPLARAFSRLINLGFLRQKAAAWDAGHFAARFGENEVNPYAEELADLEADTP